MHGVSKKLTATGIVSDSHRSSLFIPSELCHVENLHSGSKIMKKISTQKLIYENIFNMILTFHALPILTYFFNNKFSDNLDEFAPLR